MLYQNRWTHPDESSHVHSRGFELKKFREIAVDPTEATQSAH